MKKRILFGSLLIITTFLLGGLVNAQEEELPDPGILPGNPLYFLDTLFEGIGTLFTFGDEAKAERFLDMAAERLAETRELAEQGKSNRVEKAAENYEKRLAKALEKAADAKENGKDVDAISEKIAEATLRHQEVLAKVYEKVPEQAKEAIARAMEKSAHGHETALNAISKEKQNEARGKLKNKTKDVEDRLEKLREKGVPVPQMGNRGNGDGDNSEEDNDDE